MNFRVDCYPGEVHTYYIKGQGSAPRTNGYLSSHNTKGLHLHQDFYI